jgi:hypothetical protein
MSANASLPFVPLRDYNWSLSHFSTLPFNPVVYTLLSSFFAISLWLVLDLLIQIHLTFKKYGGTYYFCILLTTLGIAMHSIAFTLKLFVPGVEGVAVGEVGKNVGTTALAKIGWVLNTTGFSMVLWSRLGLVVGSRRVLRGVLVGILIDGVVLHIPIIIFSFGLSTPSATKWLPYMSHMELIQIVGFTLQDFALSTFYTYTSARLLNVRYTRQRRNLFVALLFAQGFGLVADCVMVVLDYEDMFMLKASLHPFIYAVKLKIEFLVLNQLGAVVGAKGEDFVEWAGKSRIGHENRVDVVWPSKFGTKERAGGEEVGECLRCRVLRKRGSAGTESSVATSENSSSPLNATSLGLLHEEPLGSLEIGQAVHLDSKDRALEDLERQYLGQYR